ncbi:MAG: Undecaprenyl-phosphate 4-deoxy-4-formamido-L-arabinose transferase [Anaerolineae bacterium]|nr:Undecaprenyl-phosphate 4-deoxy-4-formamido-L-arabinose transferase [Anaerolineae bacterium]
MARVSIIIPTYNSASFVTWTVESALAQTYPDYEVIVVDDGSTDNTPVVLAPYLPRITYIRQENQGPAAARNTGFRASQGDYLLFLDSDDLIPPHKLDLQVSFLEEHPNFGLVYSAWQEVDEENTRVLGEVRPNQRGHLLKAILRRQLFFFPGAAIIRRACLEQVGPFDEALFGCEDADMWVRLSLAGYAFGYIDQPLFQYRFRRGSITGSISPKQIQSWLTSLDKFFARPDLPPDIQALEAEAYSILHYETAARFYRAGQLEAGQEQVRAAIARCETLSNEWLLEWVAGSVLDSRTTDPGQLLDLIFNNLPPEAATLRSLRRRAYGRYHAAAAFLEYQNQRYHKVRRHILPALAGEPGLTCNRGFVRIALQSLLG